MRYRYYPPKSNIWGHALRRMLPSVEKAKTEAFLAELSPHVRGSTFYLTFYHGGATDSNQPAYLDLVATFVSTLGIPEYDPSRLSYLTKEQFETGLSLLIRLEKKSLPPWTGANINRILLIDRWLINGDSVPTEAELQFQYGLFPLIGTQMIFNDESEFQYLAHKFYEHFKVRLNPKHLKPMKGSMKNYHLWK